MAVQLRQRLLRQMRQWLRRQSLLNRLLLYRTRDRLPIRPDDLHQEQVPHRVLLEPHHHRFEHLEGFLLVGHQRILLRIAAQPDAFLQVVHGQQVVLPQPVQHAQHHHPLVDSASPARR